MFTLCGLILEAQENLFRDFWSPFSISFYLFSERNYLKKTQPTTGRIRPGLRRPRLYKPPPQPEESPAAAYLTLTLAPAPTPLPQPPAAAAARLRRRRSHAPFEVRRRLIFRAVFLKKKSVRRFSFSSDFPRLFSDRDF